MSQNKEEIDSKFESRQRALYDEESLQEIKEKSLNKELSLGQSMREKFCLRKRIQQKLIINPTKSSNSSKIFDNLTISQELYNKCKEAKFTLEHISEIISCLNSNNLENKYIGIVGVRKLLCNEHPPIDIIIKCNALTSIISLLDCSYPVEFQYEALWCLINISTGNNKEDEMIKKEGGIKKIVLLLNNNYDEIKEMALWCLDNLVRDSLIIKIYLAKKKIFNILITLLSTNNNEKIMSYCVSIIRNIMKNCPKQKLEKIDINKLINLVSMFIINIEYNPSNESDKHLLLNCCYILYHLSLIIPTCKDIFFQNGIIPKIISLIKLIDVEKEEKVFLPLLNIIGNLINGNANQTNQILNYDILDILKNNINNKNKVIQKEVCWIISNIASDTQKSIAKLIDNGFFPLLCNLYEKSEKAIRIEVIYALCNFTLINDKCYLEYLINNGILKVICAGIKSENFSEIVVCLEGLVNLLAFGKKYSIDGINIIVKKIENMGMFDVLERLQYNRNETIYEKTIDIIEEFFPYE